MYIYCEEDWVAEVVILEDLSTEDVLKYKLKVVRTIKQSRMFAPTIDGTEFTVDKPKGFNIVGFWTLEEIVH